MANDTTTTRTAPTVFVRVEINGSDNVHDGDTLVRARLLLPLGLSIYPVSIRAAHYDAWEVSRVRRTVDITDDELAKGKRAKEALFAILSKGAIYLEILADGARDPYGRILGALRVWDGSTLLDVSEQMIAAGNARPTKRHAIAHGASPPVLTVEDVDGFLTES